MFSKREVLVGSLKVGGTAPLSVQTMTNSRTEDVKSTIEQIRRATAAGCDLIRVSCPSPESTVALKEIIKHSNIPIIADIHFNYKRGLEAIDAGAQCIRINPGNIPAIGVNEIVRAAKYHGVSVRIGINSGSVEKAILAKYSEPSVDAIVESALLNCKKLEDLDFFNFKVSVKSSDVRVTVASYRKLAAKIDYPLHLGITEAGTLFSGTIKSAIGIGSLLLDGIGDTIRVSLSSDICEEVRVGRQILKSLSLIGNSINIVSCPTCSRTLVNVIDLSEKLEIYCASVKKHMKISILGCVVNGVGEAQHSDIGIYGFRRGIAKIYFKGIEHCEAKAPEVFDVVKTLIDEF
ncbi:MAG: flavodoxin-dependent (E)-4-hydroxy-3-methylbut-2-enyl-diphosphate synthase [Holosporales bacterium]|jgi:(E)-4-hydroxy-3-methylbut-2-enyl-diphosphate synthase|nr:flavodoxin-dependent (E)-4-hydroxy-3-methylbut-2-enyl-diphosphate synthase [Holosporales bacterium]